MLNTAFLRQEKLSTVYKIRNDKLMKANLEEIYNHLLFVLKEDIMQELEQKINVSKIEIDGGEKPMTSKEVCVHYKISASTLERYVRKGLKYSNSGKGTKRLFTKKQIEQFKKQKPWKILEE